MGRERKGVWTCKQLPVSISQTTWPVADPGWLTHAAQPHNPPAGYDPVVNVNVHTDGRYAFVELRTPDMASASLQLNGQVGPDFNQVHF